MAIPNQEIMDSIMASRVRHGVRHWEDRLATEALAERLEEKRRSQCRIRKRQRPFMPQWSLRAKLAAGILP